MLSENKSIDVDIRIINDATNFIVRNWLDNVMNALNNAACSNHM